MGAMARAGDSVRAQRSASTVAVTGAAGEIGARVARALVDAGECKKVIGIDTRRRELTDVTWRRADVRDPVLLSRLTGVDTIVHLATDRRPDAPAAERRTV